MGIYYYDNVRKELTLRGIWLARLETIELIEVGDGDVVTGYFSLKGDPKSFCDVLQVLGEVWIKREPCLYV